MKSVSLNPEKTHLLQIAVKWLDASVIQDNIFNDEDLAYKVDLGSRILGWNQHITAELDELAGYLNIAEEDEKTKTAFLDMRTNLITLQNATADSFANAKLLAENLSTITRQIDRLPNNLEGDLNGNNTVNIFDLVLVGKNFGNKL